MKLTDVLWILALILFITFGAISYFSLPVVHWSTSSNECVNVMHDGIETSCDKLPEKYERVWVE